MESKSSEQLHAGLPPYSISTHPLLPWKKWIVGSSVVLFLVAIIVAAALTGVYLTQTHTEKIVTMISSQDGQSIQQTITVNERENVALISVNTPKCSDTLLFDYKRRVIGIRRSNWTLCSLLRMEEFRTPSLSEILSFQSHKNASHSNLLTFTWKPVREADPSELGMNVKLLCSGVPVYWAETVRAESRADVITFVLNLEVLESEFITHMQLSAEALTSASVMMVAMISSQDGQSIHQAISVNDREDVALISVITPKWSDTLLFDYNKRVIGIRRSDGTLCSLLRMDEFGTPSMSEILSFQSHKNVPLSNLLTFTWKPAREVDPSELALNMKLLCRGVPIYWAEEVTAQLQAGILSYKQTLESLEEQFFMFTMMIVQM